MTDKSHQEKTAAALNSYSNSIRNAYQAQENELEYLLMSDELNNKVNDMVFGTEYLSVASTEFRRLKASMDPAIFNLYMFQVRRRDYTDSESVSRMSDDQLNISLFYFSKYLTRKNIESRHVLEIEYCLMVCHIEYMSRLISKKRKEHLKLQMENDDWMRAYQTRSSGSRFRFSFS